VCGAQVDPFAGRWVAAEVGAKAGVAEGDQRGFSIGDEDQIGFGGASSVAGALGDFDGDGVMDYAFAVSPGAAGTGEVCVYFGSGAGEGGAAGGPVFSGGGVYPPVGGKSGCGAFPVVGGRAPEFVSMVAAPFKKGGLPGLIVEDGANGMVYVLGNPGAGIGGGLPRLAVLATMAIPAGDGVGPIYTGDFNGDGKTDFIVNGQGGHSASVYLGNGDGTFQAPVRYDFDHGVRSMGVADVDGDGRADLVVGGDGGGVEVFHGNADGSFASVSEGGFMLPVDGWVSGGMVVADVDGDGCGDVVALYRVGAGGGGANALYVWYGKCDGTFGEAQIVPLGRGYRMAAVADLNGDGLPDVVVSDGAVVSVLYGLGKRGFGSEEQVYTGAGITSLAVRDVNGDGAVDLVVASGAATLSGNGVAVAGQDAGVGGIAVLLNARRSPSKPLATATTTTTIYLCVGPTMACPSAGFVMPPFSSTLTMIYGQTYNGTAIVTASDNGALPGNILFYDTYNGVQTLLCTLVASSAGSCPPSVGTGAQVGTHVFTGVYVPGSVDTTHSGSTSSPVTMTVSPDATTAVVVSVPNPSPQGRPVTLTATVTGVTAPSGFLGLYVPPSGTVTFKSGGTTIGTGTLVANGSGVNSSATLTTSTLPVGTDTITAVYGGDMDFLGSLSGPYNETITPVFATTTTLISSVTPSYLGLSVTFTATVGLVNGASTPVATGTVTFLDNGAAIGTGTLNAAGVATFTTSTLAVGSHPITASFGGDVMTGASTSAVLTQVVTALPPPGSVNFKVTVTPNPVSIGVGTGAQLAVTVTQLTSFATAVDLSCSGLPTEATCQFVNAAIASGGGSTTLVLGTMAPHSCGSATPYFVGSNGGGLGIAVPILAGLVALFVPGRRRRWLRGLIALVAVAAAMQLSGCGNCTDLGTRPGTYTVQVVGTATGSGTSEVEGEIVTVTVTI